MDNIMKTKLTVAEKENRRKLSELISISYALGVNVTPPSRSNDALKILNVLLLSLSAFGLYGQYCYVVRYSDEALTEYIECILTAFQTIISMTKLIYFLFVQEKFYKLLDAAQTGQIVQQLQIFDLAIPMTLKQLLSQRIMDILEHSWSIIRRQLVFYMCCSFCISCNYFVVVLVTNTYHQIQGTENYTMQTSFPSLFPMWESKGFEFPYYEIQFIAVGCENFISGMSAVSFDGIFIVLTLHGMALLRVLHLIIRYSTHDSIKPNLRINYLPHCIQHFQRTYDFYQAINDLYGHISLAQFGISLFILCMVLYQASIGLETNMRIFIKMVFYIMAAGFQVLLYCYNGQRLTTESEKLDFAWYDCAWYQESKEFKELIKMMIMRSSRTMPIQVSGFTTMNLATFLWIMQTSESYFLLLRNVA